MFSRLREQPQRRQSARYCGEASGVLRGAKQTILELGLDVGLALRLCATNVLVSVWIMTPNYVVRKAVLTP